MKQILLNNRPLVTPLLTANTEDALLQEISDSIAQGADAFGLMLENLPEELRTEDKLRNFIAAMNGKPVYATCYRRGDRVEETDDDRAATLLRALECGADIADIRGDMFSPCDGEITYDDAAVKKQIELIRTIHGMGKLALMSSHQFFGDNLKFISKNNAFQIANAQVERGADIAKIVTAADTEEELNECFEALLLLKKEIPVPTVFLCGGKLALRHRAACGLIGEPMVFVKEKHFAQPDSPQMPIESIVRIYEIAGLYKGEEK